MLLSVRYQRCPVWKEVMFVGINKRIFVVCFRVRPGRFILYKNFVEFISVIIVGENLCKSGNIRCGLSPMTDLEMFCTYIFFMAAFIV